jgi:MFS family permease
MDKKLFFIVFPVVFTANIYLLDFNTTILAIPSIADEFDLSLKPASWIILSSSIVMTAFLMPIGRVADLINRKFFYILSLIIYLIGIILASYSNNVYVLIFFKIIASIGSVGSSIMMFVVITSTFPKKYQGLGLSIITTSVALGMMVSPFLGGLLLDNYGWRFAYKFIFFIGLFTVLMALVFVPKLEKPKIDINPFDIKGMIYFVIFMTLFVFIINDPFSFGFFSLIHFLQIIVFLFFFLIFYKHEKNTLKPILNFDDYKNPLYLWGSISRILGFAGFSILIFINPLFLQKVIGLSESSTGTILFYSGIGTVIASAISGKLSDKFGHRVFTVSGMMLSFISNLSLSFLANDFNLNLFTLFMFINGFGIGLWMAPNMSAVLSSVTKDQYSSVSAYLNLIRNIGMAFGQSLAATILILFIASNSINIQLSELNSKSSEEVLGLFTNGWRATLIISSIIILISVFASYKTKERLKK